MNTKLKTIFIFFIIFNIFINKGLNSSVQKKNYTLKAKLIESTAINWFEVYDFTTNSKLKNIMLPDEYWCYQFDIVNNNEIYFSFEKVSGYDVQYTGIAYFNTDTKEIKELYISSHEHPPLKPIKLINSDTLIFNECENSNFVYYKYDIQKKIKEKIDIQDLVHISKFYNTDYIEIWKKDSTEIVDSNFNLIKKFNSGDMPDLYNPNDQSYYKYDKKIGMIKLKENGEYDKIIKIRGRTNQIMNFIAFDKTGRYVFFEGAGCIAFYVGVIDLENKGKILNVKPVVVDYRYGIILE